jgi:hypothetical protein
LAEIGRVHKTIHILRTLDDEEYRRRMGRELNKGEASHDLSRFLCFGKEGALRGREFGDQIHTFSCLSVLHNAVVAWNTLHIGPIVGQLRAEGQVIDDEILGLTTPSSHVPAIHAAGERASLRFLEFFAANIRNRTRGGPTAAGVWTFGKVFSS